MNLPMGSFIQNSKKTQSRCQRDITDGFLKIVLPNEQQLYENGLYKGRSSKDCVRNNAQSDRQGRQAITDTVAAKIQESNTILWRVKERPQCAESVMSILWRSPCYLEMAKIYTEKPCQRRNIAKQSQLCFRCLVEGHFGRHLPKQSYMWKEWVSRNSSQATTSMF